MLTYTDIHIQTNKQIDKQTYVHTHSKLIYTNKHY